MTATAPPNPVRTRTTIPGRIVQALFTTALLVGTAAGVVLVLGQAIGLAIGSGGMITAMVTYLGPVAFGSAAVVCICSLLSSYLSPEIKETDD